MRRLAAPAFAVLVAATIGAFFITQHLKVSDSLVSGFRVVPRSINPESGRVCRAHGRARSFSSARISFFLAGRSDTVGVFIINDAGQQVRQLGWRKLHRRRRAYFVWNGRTQSGAYAPDGTYYVEVVLQRQGRAFDVSSHPIHILTTPPAVRVTRVLATPSTGGSSTDSGAPGSSVLTPGHGSVTIHLGPRPYRAATALIYRSTTTGSLHEVGSIPVKGRSGVATWDGTLDGQPAPPGTYLIGAEVTDEACNVGRFPTLPLSSPSPTRTGVTISYLSVQPQLYPVTAGTDAALYVDAGGAAYRWTLRRPGVARPLLRGAVAADASGPLTVRVPDRGAGLYVLTASSGDHAVSVPVVVSSPVPAPVLVVLPALSWQGANPVDDTGDGIPDTLTAGDRIELDRALVTGLPAGFEDAAALLSYLQRRHLRYQLTTDVAIAEGTGPTLAGHSGVILDGPFTWMPTGVAQGLRGYVERGGDVLSLGIDSMQAEAPVQPGRPRAGTGPTAGPPAPVAADPFGARHGSVQSLGDELITTLSDPLRIFGQAAAFSGYRVYQPIAPPAGAVASLAGVAAPAPAIAGYRVGHGTVVEVGLSGFGESLQRADASRELLARVWKLLAR